MLEALHTSVHPVDEVNLPEDPRSTLRVARKDLQLQRNKLVFVSVALHSSDAQGKASYYEQYCDALTEIAKIVAERVIPAKKALGIPIEDLRAERRAERRTLRYARRTGLSEYFARLVIQGSFMRTKIDQGMLRDEPSYYEAPENSAA